MRKLLRPAEKLKISFQKKQSKVRIAALKKPEETARTTDHYHATGVFNQSFLDETFSSDEITENRKVTFKISEPSNSTRRTTSGSLDLDLDLDPPKNLGTSF